MTSTTRMARTVNKIGESHPRAAAVAARLSPPVGSWGMAILLDDGNRSGGDGAHGRVEHLVGHRSEGGARLLQDGLETLGAAAAAAAGAAAHFRRGGGHI